jgi:hypothetical protein
VTVTIGTAGILVLTHFWVALLLTTLVTDISLEVTLRHGSIIFVFLGYSGETVAFIFPVQHQMFLSVLNLAVIVVAPDELGGLNLAY